MDVVFLDANVLFSAAYRVDSGVRRIWTIPAVRLITTEYAIEEARRNIDRDDRLTALDSLLRDLQVVATVTGGLLPEGIELPESHAPILLSALSAGATHLITGDVRDFGRYFGKSIPGVLVLPPGRYLAGK